MSSVPEFKPCTHRTTISGNSSTEYVRIECRMRTTDELRVLTNLYLDLYPADRRCAVVGVFMHLSSRVRVGLTPADYDMKDGDEIRFVPIRSRTVFVTLTIKHPDGSSFTRTMRRTDRLQDLIDFFIETYGYNRRQDIFMYNGRQVSGEKSPSYYEMDDGDEITFVPISKRSEFVTLKIKCDDGSIFTRTMRRTKRLQVLIDFYHAMVPADKDVGEFIYQGRQVDGQKSPSDYMMEDGDHVFFCKQVKYLSITLVGFIPAVSTEK
ncbi:hypothetical protein GUJ93_ZPchr0013g34008 [Zizania palustris]|uniref:Ubiquitin-like domain-containing protein n=1 Tax=Zizania palustris TaxID=103762 RepID=A0A8J5X1U3_ZIZPA|nr:hypothetical protein GUJ93_ZPchr0013g34008 [Zizania palustris]